MQNIRITELPNEISNEIDKLTPLEMVKILFSIDSEIFSGWKNYNSLNHPKIHQKIASIISTVISILKSPEDSVIVLSGCGTSGRLAYFVSKNTNEILKHFNQKSEIKYTISGGDAALLTAKEGVEDSPSAGVEDLQKIINGKNNVLYIGITCGLSAPYIGGQIEYIMQQNQQCVLLGFNPIDMARKYTVDGWGKSFYDVVTKFKDCENFIVLNPVVGPEAITGSTRMKSGSATLILLYSIFAVSIASFLQISLDHKSSQSQFLDRDFLQKIPLVFSNFEFVYRQTYSQFNTIHDIIQAVGNGFQNGGNLYYVSEENFGILGFIDASECRPTFGATLDSVRGFVENGWLAMNNNEGDLSKIYPENPYLKISVDDFKENNSKFISEYDVVCVLLDRTKKNSELPKWIKFFREQKQSMKCKLCLIEITKEKQEENSQDSFSDLDFDFFDIKQTIDLKYSNIFSDETIPDFISYKHFSMKLILNSITTCAHVLKGTVFKNRMIDLQVSNNKLYFRSIQIIQEIAQCNPQEAEKALLRAIYNFDEESLFQKYKQIPISETINISANFRNILPLSILLAKYSNLSIKEAKSKLKQQPILRKIFTNF
ncbi:glucokinase regulatory protein [Anaeramoeba ignava]|uniref:Glucokinase regulatory protein n=1 Tax=Anaeramoeba ignava TaxID=1746090 RepID=A0A9Q0LPK1_ANAIG|nr:glucokinase regulatory protein [Anaeramoeba ignava]